MADYVAGQAEVGLHAELLDVAEARRREPLLAPDLRGAVFAEHGGTINPFRLTLGFAHAARARGATLSPGTEVRGLLRRGDRIAGVSTAAGDVEADLVVLAGGSWSGAIAATAGVRVPVTPRQGMMVVTEPAPFRLRHVLKPIKADRDMWRFSQPWPPGCAGQAGLRSQPAPRQGHGARADRGGQSRHRQHEPLRGTGPLAHAGGHPLRPRPGAPRSCRAERSAHAAHVGGPAAVYARRPSPPGPAPGVDGLVLATGHDGSGIGMSPVSARMVAASITKADPPLPLEPFDPRRFGDS